MNKTRSSSRTSSSKKSRVYMVRTTLILIGVALLFAIIGGMTYFRSLNNKKVYRSEFMKVEFTYPTSYQVKSELSDVVLKKGSQLIRFGKYGTNFSTTEDHVQNMIKKNRTEVARMGNITAPYQGMFVYKGNEDVGSKAYYYVRNYAVYYFSTNNPALFSDLDSIARSLRILE